MEVDYAWFYHRDHSAHRSHLFLYQSYLRGWGGAPAWRDCRRLIWAIEPEAWQRLAIGQNLARSRATKRG